MTHTDVLRQIYNTAMDKSFGDEYTFEELDAEIRRNAEYIVSRSESNKGMVTVLTTLLAHKIVEPTRDIRFHQAGMNGGFAGRGIDQAHVTPFMKSVSFPAMAESGWLTRSLEQAHPYDLQYPGKITPKEAKTAFLGIIDKIQTKGTNPNDVLVYIFVLLKVRTQTMSLYTSSCCL